MTSILALKKVIDGEIRVVWGCDSLFTAGNHKVQLKNCHKYIQFPNFVVLFAGSASVQHALEDFRHNKVLLKKPYMQMRNRRDVHKFSSEVTGTLRKRLKDLGAPEDQGHDFQLIIASSRHLYESDYWAFITEADYVTGGSGGSLLQAILISEYANVTTLSGLHDLAERALNVACQIDLHSGGPVIVREFRKVPDVQAACKTKEIAPYPDQ